MNIPESDEVAGHQYRLAQAARFLRFCRERGVDPEDVLSGKVTLDIDPICDAQGKIQPEAIDYRSTE